jgi:hypothetical protein
MRNQVVAAGPNNKKTRLEPARSKSPSKQHSNRPSASFRCRNAALKHVVLPLLERVLLRGNSGTRFSDDGMRVV